MTDVEFKVSTSQALMMFLTLSLPVLLFKMDERTAQQIHSKNWPATEGEIIQVVLKTSRDKEHEKSWYRGHVLYRYEVHGQEYTCDLTSFVPRRGRSDEAAAREDVSQYPVGMRLPVYYDPHDPTVAIIEPVVAAGEVISNVIHTLIWIGCSVGTYFTVRGWIRDYRLRKEAEFQSEYD